MRVQTVSARVALFSLLLTHAIIAPCREQWDVETHKSVKKLHGVVVRWDEKPLAGVSVEVFEHPELLLQPNKYAERNAREPIASVVTDANGRFSFPGLAPGKYELRFRKHEFDILSVIITLAPNKAGASKRLLRIVMRTAT